MGKCGRKPKPHKRNRCSAIPKVLFKQVGKAKKGNGMYRKSNVVGIVDSKPKETMKLHG